MSWGEYARSKTPLKMVFILLAAVVANLMLIEGVKVLLRFDHADALDLAALDSRNASCTVIDTYVDKDEFHTPFENYFTVHLLENSQGERHLAVVENHFLFPRVRYREDLSIPVPEFASNEPRTFSSNSNRTYIHCNLAQDGTIESASVRIERGFPFLLVFLIIAEYLAFIFLFRRDEIM